MTSLFNSMVLIILSEARGFLRSYCAGLDSAVAFVVHENDAAWTDNTFRHLERRRDRALGKKLFPLAQRYRIDHQPEIIDQIMLHKRLEEITASPNVQIGSFTLFEFGDFLPHIATQKHGRLPFGRSHRVRGD